MGSLFDKFKTTSKPPIGNNTARPVMTAPAAGIAMDDALFRKFRDFIYAQSGIYFTETKKYLLEGRVSKRVEAQGLQSFEEYFSFLSSPGNRKTELTALFEAITINETYFFRNEPQFAALESVIAPEMLKAKQTQSMKKFRLWSAASSSGEEAYTLAMILLEKFRPLYPQTQFEIVGTDINTTVLEKARQGVYREYSVKNMPQYYLNKYFNHADSTFTVKEEVRNLVKFSNVNLYDAAAMRMMTNFDIIFCCNVLIYFDTQSKQQVISHLYDSLNRNGYLFIGYSESLHGISKAFKLIHFPKTIAYKKE